MDQSGNICLDILKEKWTVRPRASVDAAGERPPRPPGEHTPLTRSRPPPPLALPSSLSQAAYSVQTVLMSLQTLLGDPNNASPLNGQAAQLWAQPAEYRRTVLKRYKEATGSAPDA